MFFHGDIGSYWYVEEFYVYDERAFVNWLAHWPEVDYSINPATGAFMLFPAPVMMEAAWDEGDYIVELPCYICDPIDQGIDEHNYPITTFWELPEEAGGVADPMIFVHELANHIDDNETCVLKHFTSDYGAMNAYAMGIVGGGGSPENRITTLALDDIYGRALDLNGGRLALEYVA